MPHCPPEQLDDIADVLTEVRGWERILEKKTGIFNLGREPFLHFNLGREPFLHFHLVEGGRRRADVKGRTGWKQFDLPRPASTVRRRAFLRELRLRYRER